MREQRFHDERFARRGLRTQVGKYYAIDAGKARHSALLAELVAPGVRMLDFGCGPGGGSARLANAGATVTAIDISPVAIRKSRRRARRRGATVDHVVMDAQSLRFPDDSFDVVYGSGILHHLDTTRACAEISRVLAPGGTALFVEPLGHNAVINLYRRMTPSLRSPDEHPLLVSDLERAAVHFRSMLWEPYDLLALAGTPLRRFGWGRRVVAALHRIDAALFARSCTARRWAWVCVLRFDN